ncbi:MAG TPA: tetratricopeptide repeat protein [Vicinamibacterales bacterium]|nr:tetratricopeptide repeat protein [Vicinamibacterales bacterium]
MLTLVAALPIAACGSLGGGPALSPLPDLAAQAPAVVAHVRGAYDAAARAPGSAAAVGSLCRAYHADLLFDAAARCYERVAALDGDWRWRYRRALIDIELGGADGLADRLREIAAEAPGFAPVWLRLGDAEFKAARYDAAADAWRRAATLPPPEPEPAADGPAHLPEIPIAAYASLGLARVALTANDPDGAREILERVTSTTPAFGPAFRLLADSYRALGRHQDAERAVYRAGRRPAFTPFADPIVDGLTRESRNSTLLLRVASDATLTVNAAWSEYLVRRAVEFDPGTPDAVLKLARVLRTLERNGEALPLFLKYASLVPGDYLGLAHIGGCLSALGRYGEAEQYFRKSLAGLDDATTHYNLGLLMSMTGRLADAEREYRRALALDPAHAGARGNLGPLLVRMGRTREAAEELRRLVADDPENVSALTNLGVVLLQMGRGSDARQYLERALQLAPEMPQAQAALRAAGGAP